MLAAILLAQFDVFLLDEPTNDLDFAGLERLEHFVDGLPGARSSSPTIARSSTARSLRARARRADHRAPRASRAAGRRIWKSAPPPAGTPRRHTRTYVEKRRDLEHRAREQRQWAVQGTRKLTKRPKDNDKAQRDFFLNRTEKQAAKVRITEKALDRLDVVDKPWEAGTFVWDRGCASLR